MTHHPDRIDSAALFEVAGRWLEALTDGSAEIVALLDREGGLRYLAANGAMEQLLGHDALVLSNTSPAELVHGEDREELVRAFHELAGRPQGRQSAEFRARHRDGHYVRLKASAVNRLDDPIVAAIVVHIRGVTGRLAISDMPDSGINLHSRASFTQAISQSLERAKVERGYGFSVLIVELDRLKRLTASYGQEVVDRLVGEVAQRIHALLRPEDTLAQLGGGEFAIQLDGVYARRQAARIADRIQKTVAMRYRVGEHTLDTSAIVGISTSERSYDKAEHIIRDAALAANRARSQGRKRRAVFQTQMRVEDTRLMSMVTALHGALQKDQFKLYYQPIVELGTRALTGFEALLRWVRPGEGIVSPAQFIPIAEETGLIVQIGQWVLAEACRQMAQWNRSYCAGSPLYVSVNLSAKQLVEEDVIGHVDAALRDSGLSPAHLKLEVTESAVLDNRDTAVALIERMKERGIKISLDDFGTGYSSFSYLHQLPYDTLKIDRSFVSRIGEGGESSEIVHAIIVLAHNLRMEVVAEGVETAAQAAQLNTMWCELAQGFYFSKPVDAEVAAGLILSRHQG